MLLAIVFGIIAVVCFVFGLRKAWGLWENRFAAFMSTASQVDWLLTLVLLVCSALGFWRAVVEFGLADGL